MKTAITVTACEPDALADPRFDRAACFAIADDDNSEWKTIPNPASKTSLGADYLAARTIIDTGVQCVISGHFGLHAFTVLHATGIEMYLIPGGKSLTAQEVLDRFRGSRLERADVHSLSEGLKPA